jgi:LuxR family quorum-sensing system transcriptional regulator CciR
MVRFALAEAFVEDARSADSIDVLRAALLDCCESMGVRYFALTHHIDFRRADVLAVRIHNYPPCWQDWFDSNGLGKSDPIHRASHIAGIGFPWTSVPELIKLTPEDRFILEQAHRVGIGDGFTVPSSIPGETLGSCSFAVGAGEAFPAEFHFICQLIGGFAFEAARRLSGAREFAVANAPILTDRQRDCVLWAARGKTDWEISVILGVGHETVIQHLKHARERYGVQKRALLAVRALFDGLISFSEILER